jgi:hypothetical protein
MAIEAATIGVTAAGNVIAPSAWLNRWNKAMGKALISRITSRLPKEEVEEQVGYIVESVGRNWDLTRTLVLGTLLVHENLPSVYSAVMPDLIEKFTRNTSIPLLGELAMIGGIFLYMASAEAQNEQINRKSWI